MPERGRCVKLCGLIALSFCGLITVSFCGLIAVSFCDLIAACCSVVSLLCGFLRPHCCVSFLGSHCRVLCCRPRATARRGTATRREAACTGTARRTARRARTGPAPRPARTAAPRTAAPPAPSTRTAPSTTKRCLPLPFRIPSKLAVHGATS